MCQAPYQLDSCRGPTVRAGEGASPLSPAPWASCHPSESRARPALGHAENIRGSSSGPTSPPSLPAFLSLEAHSLQADWTDQEVEIHPWVPCESRRMPCFAEQLLLLSELQAQEAREDRGTDGHLAHTRPNAWRVRCSTPGASGAVPSQPTRGTATTPPLLSGGCLQGRTECAGVACVSTTAGPAW